jgi:hypothetical protein
MSDDTDALLDGAVAALSAPALVPRYRAQDELVFVRDAFPASLVARWTAEACAMQDAIVRGHMPLARKGGFIGYTTLRERAPSIVATYRSPAFARFLGALAGQPLFVKPDDDEHACAVHHYDQAGDFIGWHYDTCGAKRGTSQTVLIGLIDRSSQRLECKLHARAWWRRSERLLIATAPGAMLTFNGSTIYHRLTALGAGELRMLISFAYRTDHVMSRWRRVKEEIKDVIVYHGPRALLSRRRRGETR